MVSCSSGWPGTHSVPEGDLEQISQSNAGIIGVITKLKFLGSAKGWARSFRYSRQALYHLIYTLRTPPFEKR